MDSLFAIVELMGRQHFGAKVQEVEQFGIKMLRCEVLTEPPYERDVHPQSLYAITRCTEERARLACKYLASPAVMPAERPIATLGAATDIVYDDPESDDIPFGDRLDDPEEDDETEPTLEEFECEQCKSQLTERLTARAPDPFAENLLWLLPRLGAGASLSGGRAVHVYQDRGGCVVGCAQGAAFLS